MATEYAHVLGSKDVSRQVATHAASETGLDSTVLKQMLPLVASLAMAALSKHAASSNGQPTHAGVLGMLGPLLGQSGTPGSGMRNIRAPARIARKPVVKWTSRGRSADLEDRRGEGPAAGGFGFGRVAPIGLGGIAILFVLSLLTGQNFFSLLDSGSVDDGSPVVASVPATSSPDEERRVEFVSFVLDDAQASWAQLLGPRYAHAKLVLFRDAVRSACGFAEPAIGPFYCPGIRRSTSTLDFRRTAAGSARLATSPRPTCSLTRSAITCRICSAPNSASSPAAGRPTAGDASVGLELQADCYAGIWGH